MPNLVTELLSDQIRVRADLSNAGATRVYVNVAAAAAKDAIIFCHYSFDGGATWHPLTAPLAADAAGSHASTWSQVPASALGDVLVRAVSQHGGGASVDIRSVHLQVK